MWSNTVFRVWYITSCFTTILKCLVQLRLNVLNHYESKKTRTDIVQGFLEPASSNSQRSSHLHRLIPVFPLLLLNMGLTWCALGVWAFFWVLPGHRTLPLVSFISFYLLVSFYFQFYYCCFGCCRRWERRPDFREWGGNRAYCLCGGTGTVFGRSTCS